AAPSDAAPWLADAIEKARRARSIAPNASADRIEGRELAPLSGDEIARWLTALVGSSATAWSAATFASGSERALAEALHALAREVPPGAWSYRDVEAAVLGERRFLATGESVARVDAAEAARLALALSRSPADVAAIEAVERARDAPPVLV